MYILLSQVQLNTLNLKLPLRDRLFCVAVIVVGTSARAYVKRTRLYNFEGETRTGTEYRSTRRARRGRANGLAARD